MPSSMQDRGGWLTLLNHFVGAEEDRGRHGEAERLGGFHIDHKFPFGRLLYRQIGRVGAFEDLIHVVACATEQIGYIGAVDDQSAIGETEMNGGQTMFCRERDNSR